MHFETSRKTKVAYMIWLLNIKKWMVCGGVTGSQDSAYSFT